MRIVKTEREERLLENANLNLIALSGLYILYSGSASQSVRLQALSLIKSGRFITKKMAQDIVSGKILIEDKPPAVKLRQRHIKRDNTKNEFELQSLIVEDLKKKRIKFKTQVECVCGIADIVTEFEVIEVKYLINRSSFLKAVGQVLLYRQAIAPTLTAVIICTCYNEQETAKMFAIAQQLGVEVRVWS